MTPLTDVYAREVVMARVNHLVRRKQNEIERITRIIRACFEPEKVQAPQPGKIRRIILIGPYARADHGTRIGIRSNFRTMNSGSSSNHPAFKDERCWQLVRDVIESELGNRCAVAFDIYSKADIRIARVERDTFILDRIEAGIMLYRASRDAPLNERERREARQ